MVVVSISSFYLVPSMLSTGWVMIYSLRREGPCQAFFDDAVCRANLFARGFDTRQQTNGLRRPSHMGCLFRFFCTPNKLAAVLPPGTRALDIAVRIYLSYCFPGRWNEWIQRMIILNALKFSFSLTPCQLHFTHNLLTLFLCRHRHFKRFHRVY